MRCSCSWNDLKGPRLSVPTVALTSSSSSLLLVESRTHQVVPTTRTPHGLPPPASSSGRLRVSTPAALMAPTSTLCVAQTTSRFSLLATITVLLTSSTTPAERVASPDATVVTPSTSSVSCSVLATNAFSPSVDTIRPSCSGRNAEHQLLLSVPETVCLTG